MLKPYPVFSGRLLHLTVIGAVYLIDLMAMTGLYDLFSLTLSTGFVVASGLVVMRDARDTLSNTRKRVC
jgi:hypothetical protein